jgi:hypothetical protein
VNPDADVHVLDDHPDRAISLDGDLHFLGAGCCARWLDPACPTCGGVLHRQPAHACIQEACETCDLQDFYPAVRDDRLVEGGWFLPAPA